MDEKSTFESLYPIDVSDRTEKKNGMTYLSWAWAWAEVKKRFPNAKFEYIKNEQGWNYHTDGKTAWVEVAIEIDGLRYEEHLPIMDFKNKSIPLDSITSFDVNKAQKRCLTKCLALFGLGLYVYAGEDLPEDLPEEDGAKDPKQKPDSKSKKATTKRQPIQDLPKDCCTICQNKISEYHYNDPKSGKTIVYSADAIIKKSVEKFKAPICYECMMKKAIAERNKKKTNMDGEYQAIIHEDAGDRA